MRATTDDILDSVISGERLSDDNALLLLKQADLIALGVAADKIRKIKHPENIVTYIVDRNINYTNTCTASCLFCAFYRSPGDNEGYLLSREELDKKIEETIALGGNQILLQGGLHPDLAIDWYEDLLRHIKKTHGIYIHGFSGPEIVNIAKISRLDIRTTIKRLKQAGLDSIPGGGAEILVKRVRNLVSPKKCSLDQWLEVMRRAHELEMKTTATMMYGHRETLRERIESMSALRSLQDETGGFTAFIAWPFQPDSTMMSDVEKSGGHEYLKMVAISRLYLDNIENIQASWVTQGAKISQLSLSFGANDFGSTMIEENVVASAGVSFKMSEKEIRELITSAGFDPARRNMRYDILDDVTC